MVIMKKTFNFLKHEFFEMLPPTIFFFVVFHIITFTRALMAEQYGITISSSVAATIGALIVGKSILVADALPFANLFHQKKLVYNIVWRTILYAAIATLLQFLDEFLPLLSRYGTLATAIEHLMEEIKWPQFWATHILIVFFLIVYNIAAGVIGVIGRDKFIEILFTSKKQSYGKN